MKRSYRFLRVLGVAGLLVGLLSALVAPVAAQDNGTDGPIVGVPGFDMLFENVDPAFLAGDNTIYFPWVANDDDFGLGPADTSISIQNLEDRDSQIWIYTGNGDGTWTLATTAYLSRFASKTFTAAQIGIGPGEGAPVAVTAYHRIPGFTMPGVPVGGFIAETPVILSNPITAEDGGGESTQVLACVVNAYTADGSFGTPLPFMAAVDFTWDGTFYAAGDLVPWSTQDELQDILNTVNEGNTGPLVNPFGGLNADGDCFDAIDNSGVSVPSILDSVTIGGVAKAAVEGESLPYTSGADTAVSGYNALNGIEVYQFDEWYLPIVQTNCGPGGCWDSMIRVSNLANLNSAVTIRFFPADDGSGSLQTGFQVQQLVNGGDTWHVNLGDLVPEGWVGSAHIYSDGAVFAMVDRYKVGYNMWITNTGSSTDWENIAQVPGANGRYALFAPHVLLDWFGWNTGINVANLASTDNNISIQYFNTLGNATQVLNQRLAAHGMTYFYDPSIAAQNVSGQDVQSDPNAGVVGSAIIWSDLPVAAAVDATKYPETDPRGGVDLFQATSYNATANVFPWQAVPLVQKGNPIDGMGDTSGINIMNPNASAVTANVYFVNPSGFNAQNFGVSSVTIPGFANGFVYTLWQHNLPNGFVGSAQVVASQPVAAVSANVNYQVDGDGSAIFNAFNPCGLYRIGGGCSFGDPFEPGDQSVTKTFLDPAGDPVAGVGFAIVSTPGTTDFPYQRDGVSGTDGSRTFTNVPVGVYDLHVTSVPPGFEPVDPTEVQETFVVTRGDHVELVNVLDWAQTFTKTVIVTGSAGDDSDGVTLSGVDVAVYEQVGTDGAGDPVVGELVFTGVTDAAGQTGAALGTGDYVLCLYDEDGLAILPNGEVVPVDLDATAPNVTCEAFEVVAGETTNLVNEVDLDGDAGAGVLDVFVFGLDPTLTSATLSQVEDGDIPAAGLSISLNGDDATTDENGWATLTGLDDGTYTLTFEFNNPENAVLDAFGGPLNATDVVWDDTSVTFDYSITGDVAQDGVLNDEENEGTPDLFVEVLDPLDGDGPPADEPSLVKGWFDVDLDEPVDGIEFCLAESGSLDCVAGTETTSGDNGVGLVFDVEPGTYDLVVTAWPVGAEYGSAPLTVDEDVEITEDPVGILNILPLDATPESDNGTLVKMWYDLADDDVVAGVEFCLVLAGETECLGESIASGDDGVGIYPELTPGTYSIVVTDWPADSDYEQVPPVTVDTGVVIGSNAYTGLLNLLPFDGDGNGDDPGDGENGALTKTFTDDDENPVAGVTFCLAPTGTDNCVDDSEGTTGSGGSATVVVPAGEYDLYVTDVPVGYDLPTGPQDPGLVIVAGETTPLTNNLDFATGTGTVTKTFQDTAGDPVAGVEFCIAPEGSTGSGDCDISGTSDTDGADTLTAEAGVYELFVTSVPDGFAQPEGSQETFRILAGTNIDLLNVLFDGDPDTTQLLVGLNANLEALGLTEITVELYANPDNVACEVVVGDPLLQIDTDGAVTLGDEDFIGLTAQVAALDVDATLLGRFGDPQDDSLLGLGICLDVSAGLLDGDLLDLDILLPATINAVGSNYVANAQLEGTSINLNLLSGLLGGLLDVTVYSNTTGGTCPTGQDLANLPVLATDLAGTILPLDVCIEVEANVLNIGLLSAVIGADLTPGSTRTLGVDVSLVPLGLILTLS